MAAHTLPEDVGRIANRAGVNPLVLLILFRAMIRPSLMNNGQKARASTSKGESSWGKIFWRSSHFPYVSFHFSLVICNAVDHDSYGPFTQRIVNSTLKCSMSAKYETSQAGSVSRQNIHVALQSSVHE
ncbi:MAG: hypothetical protein ABR557_12645 [Pyrinomonadaceae bacterium]